MCFVRRFLIFFGGKNIRTNLFVWFGDIVVCIFWLVYVILGLFWWFYRFLVVLQWCSSGFAIWSCLLIFLL